MTKMGCILPREMSDSRPLCGPLIILNAQKKKNYFFLRFSFTFPPTKHYPNDTHTKLQDSQAHLPLFATECHCCGVESHAQKKFPFHILNHYKFYKPLKNHTRQLYKQTTLTFFTNLEAGVFGKTKNVVFLVSFIWVSSKVVEFQ